MPPGDNLSQERWERYRRDRKAGKPRLVSEGDSWFDYPQHRNVVDHLVATGAYAVLRFETSGDTLRRMVAPSSLGPLLQWVRSERPLAVLLSGGGNDLFEPSVEDPSRRWIWEALRPAAAVPAAERATPRAYLRRDVWEGKLAELRAYLVTLVSRIGPHAPVVGHGYDYLPVTGARAAYNGVVFVGPWILPSMQARGIEGAELRRAIVRCLIDDHNAMLAQLERERPLDFLHADVRGTVGPDAAVAQRDPPDARGVRAGGGAYPRAGPRAAPPRPAGAAGRARRRDRVTGPATARARPTAGPARAARGAPGRWAPAALAACAAVAAGAPPAAAQPSLPTVDLPAPRVTAALASAALWRDVLLADRESAIGAVALPRRSLGPVPLYLAADATVPLRPRAELRAGRLATVTALTAWSTLDPSLPPAGAAVTVRAGARGLLFWDVPPTAGARRTSADAELLAGASLHLPVVRAGVRALTVDAEYGATVGRRRVSSATLSAALPFEAPRDASEGCCQIAVVPRVFVAGGALSLEALRGARGRPPFGWTSAGVDVAGEFRLARRPVARETAVLWGVRASRRAAVAGRSGVALRLGGAVGW
jgi:hypothetical protein